jgi:hypothetical protein
MKPYNHVKIANELDATASGSTYHGNTLHDALELPWATHNDKAMLGRYMYGSELLSDRLKLQEFAILTRNKGEGFTK